MELRIFVPVLASTLGLIHFMGLCCSSHDNNPQNCLLLNYFFSSIQGQISKKFRQKAVEGLRSMVNRLFSIQGRGLIQTAVFRHLFKTLINMEFWVIHFTHLKIMWFGGKLFNFLESVSSSEKMRLIIPPHKVAKKIKWEKICKVLNTIFSMYSGLSKYFCWYSTFNSTASDLTSYLLFVFSLNSHVFFLKSFIVLIYPTINLKHENISKGTISTTLQASPSCTSLFTL